MYIPVPELAANPCGLGSGRGGRKLDTYDSLNNSVVSRKRVDGAVGLWVLGRDRLACPC